MRKAYRNGDPITLGNCDGCEVMSINGVLCHEAGCPDAWRDYKVECPECGSEFFALEQGQKFCSEHCGAMHNGWSCDCEICRETADELAC